MIAESLSATRCRANDAVELQLFRQSDPFTLVEQRAFDGGSLIVGRDPSSDWVIVDEDRSVSRRHCELAWRDGIVQVRDTSANGVFLGAAKTRIAPGVAVQLAVGETLRLGEFMIVLSAAAKVNEPADAFTGPILASADITPAELATPEPWAFDGGDEVAADGSLLDAFCAGARLDVSAFAGEEPVEVMRRLGAVYQEMVLGLGALVQDRASLKTEYRLGRTTVGSEGNNPFRWAPAQRVALDILRPKADGFLSGPMAVTASFQDLKKHQHCVMAGLRAAVETTLDELSPTVAEARAKAQPFTLRPKEAVAFSEYVVLHAEVRREADDNADGVISKAFRAAYERQLTVLDNVGGVP